MGNGSDSDNWRDRNGVGNGLVNHAEFPASVSSPKRKQNKSGELPSRYLSELFFFFKSKGEEREREENQHTHSVNSLKSVDEKVMMMT